MTDQQKDAELSKQFDTEQECKQRATDLGPRWAAHKSFKQRGKWQLTYLVGYIS